jgi:hypothetical protein
VQSALSKLLVITSIGLFCSVACAAQPPVARPSYDGRWWLSISNYKRSGFVVGYFDCYNFEYRGKAPYHTKSYDRYRDLMTTLYQDSTHRRQSPSEVIDQLQDKPGEEVENPGGEPAHGAHGGNDGHYWRQMSINGHDEQLGFIEGYLYCHEQLAHNKGGAFTKTPAEYRALIDKWYRYNELTDDIDAKREPEAIADALFKVRTGIK